MAAAADRPAEELQSREELLRDLLTYSLGEDRARRATQSILTVLGGIDGVFNASETALAALPGMDRQAAHLLRLSVDAAGLFLEERSWDLRRVYDSSSAAEILRPTFVGRRTEAVAVLLLDSRGRMVYQDVLCEGAFSEVPLRLRTLLRLVVEYQSQELFLAHNHPSGVAFPSQSDLQVTCQLMDALSALSATLCDHLIFAGDSWYSFAQGGVLPRLWEISRSARREEAAQIRRMNIFLQGEEKGGGKP